MSLEPAEPTLDSASEFTGTIYRIIADLTNLADDLITRLAASVSANSPSQGNPVVVTTGTVGTLAASSATVGAADSTVAPSEVESGWDLGGVPPEPTSDEETPTEDVTATTET